MLQKDKKNNLSPTVGASSISNRNVIPSIKSPYKASSNQANSVSPCKAPFGSG